MGLEPRWWENATMMYFTSPKFKGRTLKKMIEMVDEVKEWGFNAICMGIPYHGGMQYSGLDVLDYYAIDPALGSMDDFNELVTVCHGRDVAVTAFLNLGYAAAEFPPFLQACDDVKAGVDSPESRWFVWSDTKSAELDRSQVPFFLNDVEVNSSSWQFSERAGKYHWVRWRGKTGDKDLPQFNYGEESWQEECRRVVRFWMDTGIDGIMVDAVPEYTNCTWELNNSTITDVVHEYPNSFVLPEGAGIRSDPVAWVTDGHYDSVQDYGIRDSRVGSRWGQAIRLALESGNPTGIEIKLRLYRDRVVKAGGITWARVMGSWGSGDGGGPALRVMGETTGNLSPAQMLLEVVTLATVGELFVASDRIFEPVWSAWFQSQHKEIMKARQKYPTLCATGSRRRLPTNNDGRYYAFLRTSNSDNEMLLVVLNFQSEDAMIEVYLDRETELVDIFSGKRQNVEKTLELPLPPYGYSIFEVHR